MTLAAKPTAATLSARQITTAVTVDEPLGGQENDGILRRAVPRKKPVEDPCIEASVSLRATTADAGGAAATANTITAVTLARNPSNLTCTADLSARRYRR